MASSLSVGINIHHESKRKVLYFKPSETVQRVIDRAVCELEIDKRERSDLTLIHQGNRLSERSKVQDFLGKCQTTVCFLQVSTKVESSLKSSQLSELNNRSDIGVYLGFCTSCGAIARVRPIYKCTKCDKDRIVLDNPANLFEDDLDLIRGNCSNCGNHDKPSITYRCANAIAAKPHSVLFMPHLRENVEKLPCMKCENEDEEIIKFHCNHTMCLLCFGDMCKMQIGCGGFKNYPNLGYSICCPAGGPQCSISPIADPHHFYLVDGKKQFYADFQEKSFAVFCEEEQGVKCQKCKNVLNMSQGQEAEVVPPACATPDAPTQAGGAWVFFSKIFRRTQTQSSAAAERKTRRQVTCSQCKSQFCGECVQLWHEGDCPKLSAEQEAAAKKYHIDPKRAAASEWKP